MNLKAHIHHVIQFLSNELHLHPHAVSEAKEIVSKLQTPTFDNYHLFEIKYLPCTAHLPSQIKINSTRFKQSVKLGYCGNHNKTSIAEIAKDYLTSQGFEIVGQCGGDGFTYLISTTFKPFKEQ